MQYATMELTVSDVLMARLKVLGWRKNKLSKLLLTYQRKASDGSLMDMREVALNTKYLEMHHANFTLTLS